MDHQTQALCQGQGEWSMSDLVPINELKLGMYVHLDLGWMAHPFARSSFRIERQDQIDQIRELGLKNLRWDPARSKVAQEATASRVENNTSTAAATADILSEEEQKAQERRADLAEQRRVAAECEAQYAEAGQACRQAFDRVRSDPEAARRDTEALSQALMSKMLSEDELCIRTLNVAAGDLSTAHAMNVSVVSMLLARMMGLPAEQVADIGTGALMHDVGKIELPRRLWFADDQLNSAERAAYASHVDHGLSHARLMGLGPTPLAIIAQHHEYCDGSGFPRGLRGDAILLASRIVSAVNRFDNLCNPPVLTLAMTPHEALARMFSQHANQYDAQVLNSFIRMMGVYPAGSVVQLTDDRFALVISVNAARPLKPKVLTFDSAVPPDEALHLDLAAMPKLGIRRSLRATQLPAAARDYLAPKQRMAYFFEPGVVPEMEALAA
jgi:HD-GYP domain-containing protein (c-di-GMP phosphodiesterase class II)